MNFLATPRRRRFLFASLYLSEGAPIGFLWLALPTWLRVDGVPIEEITRFTALLVVPWTLKFAWAPLIDILQTERWTVRHWILSAQTIMGATLLSLLVLDLRNQFQVIAPLLLIHGFAAATQDVAIDALCIGSSSPDERGRMNGWMQAGMLLGRASMGGGALLLAPSLGQRGVVILLVLITTFSMILVLGSRQAGPARRDSILRRLGEVGQSMRTAVSSRNTWLGLAFALIGGAAFKSVEVVLGPLLVDRGFTQREVGIFAAVPMIGFMILGSVLGGVLADRLGRKRFVATGLLYFVATITALAVTDAVAGGERGIHLLIFLAATAVGIGFFTAASYALFMDLTLPTIAATQFSAFMGATNGCEAWSVFAIGRIIGGYGYPAGMLAMCAASLAALPALLRMRLPGRAGGAA